MNVPARRRLQESQFMQPLIPLPKQFHPACAFMLRGSYAPFAFAGSRTHKSLRFGRRLFVCWCNEMRGLRVVFLADLAATDSPKP